MKVGDKVVLKKFESNDVLDFTQNREEMVGSEVEVASIHSDGTFSYGYNNWWLQSACEPVKNERYFLFSYVSGSVTGNIFMKNTEGEMPSNKFLVEYLKKEHLFNKVIITNIFEFKSEQDFLDFTSNE